MNLPIFYQEDLVLNAGLIELGPDASKHVVQVLRMKEGEGLQLTDGKGNLITGTIEAAHKKNCIVAKTAQEFRERNAKKLTIAISPIKNTSRFEWFLEKATEIGVYAISPIICKRTEKLQFRKDRMQSILISAMLQSKQVYLPQLNDPQDFSAYLQHQTNAYKCIAHCEDEANKNDFADLKMHPEMLLLVGPEGDFTNDEIATAIKQNFTPVSLGSNRLRTETAGVVAAALFCI